MVALVYFVSCNSYASMKIVKHIVYHKCSKMMVVLLILSLDLNSEESEQGIRNQENWSSLQNIWFEFSFSDPIQF